MHKLGHKALVFRQGLGKPMFLRHAECQDVPVQLGSAQELRTQRVALSLQAQQDLQLRMHRVGHKAWVFIETIRQGLENEIF